MSISSPALMAREKHSRRSFMNFFSNSSVPLRRSSVQTAPGKFGLVDLDADPLDLEDSDRSPAKCPPDPGIAGSIPEDIIREIAPLLSIADILSFSLTVYIFLTRPLISINDYPVLVSPPSLHALPL
jgi:hypothetical protein